MRRPRKLGVDLNATDALEFMTIPARCCGLQDLSDLQELQLVGVEGCQYSAMALEGLLRQACVLSHQRRMAALKPQGQTSCILCLSGMLRMCCCACRPVR